LFPRPHPATACLDIVSHLRRYVALLLIRQCALKHMEARTAERNVTDAFIRTPPPQLR